MRSDEQREEMVRSQIRGRGVRDARVLRAMAAVPREEFVPERLREFAYVDSALPIEEGQTISQPLIVAEMAAALQVGPGDHVLEVGTGSGYAAAVLSRMVDRVYTVERHESLLQEAEERFRRLGYDNIEALFSDGTLGWPEHAPYDGILVSAAGPEVPDTLKRQLAVGAHLVIPVGRTERSQELLRVTRSGQNEFREERLGHVNFVPLVGVEGWEDEDAYGRTEGGPRVIHGRDDGRPGAHSRAPHRAGHAARPPEAANARAAPARPPRVEGATPEQSPNPESPGSQWLGASIGYAERSPAGRGAPPAGREGLRGRETLPSPTRPAAAELVRWHAEPFEDLEDAELGPLLDRIGRARLVLLGEASHGTSEFYRLRARITRELIVRHAFKFVAVEADWPDAARIDRWVRHLPTSAADRPAFVRFPTWMCRNREVREFVDWLRDFNAAIDGPEGRVSFHGLDLYSLYTSLDSVLTYLDDVDPEAAAAARERYGCLTPWQGDPASYGAAAVTAGYRDCEDEVARALADLLRQRLRYQERDGERFFDAEQNARLVRSAERYYRVMYYGSRESWNLRDSHMFGTLQRLLEHWGEGTRGVVWAHNSHLGDASATEMGARGEHNLGQLCRRAYGSDAYLVGFGTHTGTVAAAHEWGGPMEVMTVQPSHPRSYERLSHDSGHGGFLLSLREPGPLRQSLSAPRLQRAIGVVYRPSTELASHYFEARLPRQFDEWIWVDETRAVEPIPAVEAEGGVPETYPFGL